jgi:hypothetical protein
MKGRTKQLTVAELSARPGRRDRGCGMVRSPESPESRGQKAKRLQEEVLGRAGLVATEPASIKDVGFTPPNSVRLKRAWRLRRKKAA